MIGRYCDGIIPPPVPDRNDSGELLLAAGALPGTVRTQLERFAFHDALAAIWTLIASANRYVSAKQPWALARQAASGGEAEAAAVASRELQNCLSDLAQVLCVAGRCLAPLLPSTSGELFNQLGVERRPLRLDEKINLAGNRISLAHVLFPKPEPSSASG